MNLNQLEYFVSAAEHLNFTRAAKQCYISQSAMTLHLQALEIALGVQLILSHKRRIELTPA